MTSIWDRKPTTATVPTNSIAVGTPAHAVFAGEVPATTPNLPETQQGRMGIAATPPEARGAEGSGKVVAAPEPSHEILAEYLAAIDLKGLLVRIASALEKTAIIPEIVMKYESRIAILEGLVQTRGLYQPAPTEEFGAPHTAVMGGAPFDPANIPAPIPEPEKAAKKGKKEKAE